MPKSPPRYPDAFRERAVDLVRTDDRSLPQIARALGMNDQTLRNWVAQAEIDAGRVIGVAGSKPNLEVFARLHVNDLNLRIERLPERRAHRDRSEPCCVGGGRHQKHRRKHQKDFVNRLGHRNPLTWLPRSGVFERRQL